MNCRRFQNELHEYVEGSLSASAQAAAERHLAGCNACRQAVQKEQRLAQFISSRLQQDAMTLTLRPDIRNRILKAAEAKSTPSAAPIFIAEAWKRFFRLAAIPASLLLIAVFLLMTYFPGTRMSHKETISFVDNNLRPAVAIQISYHTLHCQFHREGNLVTDTVSDETVVASGMLRPDSQESFKQ
jgi:predicted anti-sigma-YlaC factor YlaD